MPPREKRMSSESGGGGMCMGREESAYFCGRETQAEGLLLSNVV